MIRDPRRTIGSYPPNWYFVRRQCIDLQGRILPPPATYTERGFHPWAGYAMQLGTWQAGDFNGDGKADLAHL